MAELGADLFTTIPTLNRVVLDKIKNAKLTAISSERIFLQLDITNICNFRCTYCYRIKYLGTTKIDANTAINRINMIFDKFKPRSMRVEFFGGEPLTNLDTIIETIKYFKNRNDITFATISNCSIYSNDISKLVKLGKLDIQFSIDHQERHNKYRRDINNNETFNRVINTYKKYVNDGVIAQVRTSVGETGDLPKIYEHILALNSKYKTTKFALDFIDSSLKYTTYKYFIPKVKHLHDKYNIIICPISCFIHDYKCPLSITGTIDNKFDYRVEVLLNGNIYVSDYSNLRRRIKIE